MLEKSPGHPRADRQGYVLEHIIMAEAVLGRYLPIGAEVHHVNSVRNDNRNSNLVICESKSYHRLLHTRAAGYLAIGDPHARKCSLCHCFDSKSNLVKGANRASYHRACAATYARGFRRKRRQNKEGLHS